MIFERNNDPHTRLDILTGERVLVSPHRSKRPWQGQVEKTEQVLRPEYDPECYLCPGNTRAGGQSNPEYSQSFVFTNDFSALLDHAPLFDENEDDLFFTQAERGICKVISFSARHDLTMAEMSVEAIKGVVNVWQQEFHTLASTDWIRYIQIFENKGAMMGCSNPHPHGQIWAQSSVPSILREEGKRQKRYYEQHSRTLLTAYLEAELKKGERIVIKNKSFVALVPYWAKWPFETMIISRRPVQDIRQFDKTEKEDMAYILQELTARYDNLFETSFPYSAGMHQAPLNSGDQTGWHWHMHFYPPLLRSANVKKFMVGYEMMADAQRDITPELAARRLQEVGAVHYKNLKHD